MSTTISIDMIKPLCDLKKNRTMQRSLKCVTTDGWVLWQDRSTVTLCIHHLISVLNYVKETADKTTCRPNYGRRRRGTFKV